VPSDWKSANVCPIFKKGSRNDIGNYRQDSLTSVLCKITETESIIKIAMTQFADECDLVCSKQHGLVWGRSCLTNLLESLEAWTNTLDEGYGLDIIYLDYQNAFLIKNYLLKLISFRKPDEIMNWIETFLSGRRIRVEVQGAFSSWTDILSGVPQASVYDYPVYHIYPVCQ